MARSRRSPAASTTVTGSPAARGRAERVEALLGGESLDTTRLPYDFEVNHLAAVAVGEGAHEAVEELGGAAGFHQLVVEAGSGTVWGWLGKRKAFDPAELEALAFAKTPAGVHMAIGEPGRGLAGWRLTHHQARAALAVAIRGGGTAVRYRDVALLTAVVRDEVLATSMRQLYLEPLEGGRGGGEELHNTLRAYFAADRNVSVAGEAIGVTRQAVARRVRSAEERLGRPVADCGAELEIALRLDALDAAPKPLSAP